MNLYCFNRLLSIKIDWLSKESQVRIIIPLSPRAMYAEFTKLIIFKLGDRVFQFIEIKFKYKY